MMIEDNSKLIFQLNASPSGITKEEMALDFLKPSCDVDDPIDEDSKKIFKLTNEFFRMRID